MTQQISPLQVYMGKTWTGLTTDNHLGSVFNEHPHLASSVMSRVFAQYDHMNLDALLSLFGAEEEFPDDRDFEWYLKGDDEKAIPVVSYSAANTATPGLNQTIFRIVFPEKYFSKTDVLIADNREFKVRVMTEPFASGTDWVYEVALLTGDPSLFMPPALLTSGSYFSKENSIQEKTLSKTGGETHYSSPFKMRNSFTTLRKKDIIPGNMINRPLVIEMLDPKSNKSTKMWTQYAEWEFLTQWYKEKNRCLLYDQANKNANGTYSMKGDSGFEIKVGAGLRQQISPAYKFTYNNFKIDWLEDILIQLSVNILPEDKRHFVALTGEYGMRQFHKALEDYTARFNVRDEKRLFGSGQNLGFGGQYVTFRGSNGVDFTLLKLPEYDDRVHNRIPHPDGGVTESYRYTILNFGTTGGKKNLRRVYPKGEKEKLWHIAGSCSPYGPNTSFKTGSSSPVDGYEIHAMSKGAVILENPMSCGELIYSSTP
jgi:hypothetical protein